MGFDEIFVHMVDNYYTTGEAYWADSTVVISLAKRADALRDILIGSVAPELILIDTNFNFRSLHHSDSPYMIVMFYEHDCGHCKKEISELKNWLSEDSLGLQIFAVCTDTSINKWKKFIVKEKLNWINVNGTRSVTADYHTLYDIRSTPTLFLLNEQKEIIAKRILAAQMKPFLLNYHRNKQLKKN
jgi:peroxiredoxin